MIKTMLQTLGIALTGQSTINQSMLFLLGVGESGKSTIMYIMKLAIQNYMLTLGRDTFSKGYSKIDKVMNSFKDKQYLRITFVNELSDSKMNDSLFKDFIDGNIQATVLYKDGSNDFKHNTKCVFASNIFPNIKIDSGTQRRINSFEHKSKFVDNPKDVNESNGICLKDKLLLTNLENNDKF